VHAAGAGHHPALRTEHLADRRGTQVQGDREAPCAANSRGYERRSRPLHLATVKRRTRQLAASGGWVKPSGRIPSALSSQRMRIGM
jgi:hypothetical protein